MAQPERPSQLRGQPDDAAARWLVQKYGGTSVGKFLDTITGEIAPNYLSQHRLVIVCSARSGKTKALGTTNLLLRAASEALRPPSTPGSAAGGRSSSLSGSFSPFGNGGGRRVGSTAHGWASGAATPQRRRSLSRSNSYLGGSGRNGVRDQNGSTSSAAAVAVAKLEQTFSRLQMSPTRTPVPDSPVLDSSANASPASDSPAPNGASASPATSSITATPTAYPTQDSEEVPIGFDATIDKILEDHLEAARSAVKGGGEILETLEEELYEDCERLRDFLTATQIIDEISPRSKDLIIGVGEKLSCRVVTAALRDRGIDAELVTLEDIVQRALADDDADASTGAGSGRDDPDIPTLDQAFYAKLAHALGDRLRETKGVPVVTGYFGVVPGSLLAQIGRGYTDLCAALCAVGLDAEELQVWKEVDGIFTADPRKVPTARLIPMITPDEAAELTYYGSEVIHPFTMEQVINAHIPIRIKNVENPSGGGTVIFPDEGEAAVGGDGGAVPSIPVPWGVFQLSSGAGGAGSTNVGALRTSDRRYPTAVTIKDNILILSVLSNRKTISHGFFARIFGCLDRHGVVVDLISTSEVYVSMAIDAGIGRRTLDRVVTELKKIGTVSLSRNMAILSLVGKDMKNMVGIAGKMFSTLADGNVNIEMISQGASEINISCVIHEASSAKALNLIHYSLLKEEERPGGAHFGRSFF